MAKLKISSRTGLRRFSYSDIKAWGPCYDPKKFIAETWRGSAVDILNLESVPAADRFWAVLREDVTSERVMRLFAVWCARQSEKNTTDPRVKACLDTVEAFLEGKATLSDLNAARSAAWSAAHAAWSEAWSAAWSAAESAASAARSAARSAAWSAAWSAAESAASAARSAARSAAESAASAAWSAAESAAESAQTAKLIEMLEAEGAERLAKKRKANA